MTGTRSAKAKAEPGGNAQIEYLLFQSTQGIHFMFENADIAQIMSRPTEDQNFFTDENRDKIQTLLSKLLDSATMLEKRTFLENLPKDEFELLLRAYFQLVEKTILAHSNIRH